MGLSVTPERLDDPPVNKQVQGLTEKIIYEVSYNEALDNNYISDFSQAIITPFTHPFSVGNVTGRILPPDQNLDSY